MHNIVLSSLILEMWVAIVTVECFPIPTFGKVVIEGTLPLPPDSSLTGTSQPDVPYVIVGDAAFPLKINLMQPYPGRNLPEPQAIFNYRLSRARRVIENSFGILAAIWRSFRRPIIATPDNVVYTKAQLSEDYGVISVLSPWFHRQ